MQSDSLTRNFEVFSQEKLKAAVAAVNVRRRRGLYLSLAAGAAVFAVGVAGVYLFFRPYAAMMSEHGISYSPLLYCAPASLALIVFCLVYILLLRSAVKEFREGLVREIALFIDAGLVHEAERPLPKEELAGDLFAPLGGAAVSGTDMFRGRVPGASVRFSDIRLRRAAGADGKPELLTGLYFCATTERKFALPLLVFPSTADVSRSGVEASLRASGETVGAGLLRLDDAPMGRQILVPSGGEEFVLRMLSSPAFANLEALRRQSGGMLCLSCVGNTLRLAVLSKSGRTDVPGMFDEFDFAHCREFCRTAKLCMEMTRGIAERNDVWEV